jgi:hypothetical protein
MQGVPPLEYRSQGPVAWLLELPEVELVLAVRPVDPVMAPELLDVPPGREVFVLPLAPVDAVVAELLPEAEATVDPEVAPGPDDPVDDDVALLPDPLPVGPGASPVPHADEAVKTATTI